MDDKIIDYLSSIGFYPLDESNFIVFTLSHKPPYTDDEIKKTAQFIKSKVKGLNGLYIYANNKGEILYIGKAKPLSGRLIAHYQESRGLPEHMWHPTTAFFAANQGDVMVFCKELEDEANRRKVEKMITEFYEPVFFSWKKAFNLSKKNKDVKNHIKIDTKALSQDKVDTKTKTAKFKSTFEKNYEKATQETKDLWSLLESYIKSLGNDVKMKANDKDRVFTGTHWFASVHCAQQWLLVYIGLEPNSFRPSELDDGFINISNKNTTSITVRIKNTYDLDRAKPLIERAYRKG